MARGDLELSFVTKITSPKNLLKALAGAIFGVALALLGMSRPTMRAEPLAAHLLALAWAAHAIVLQRTGAATACHSGASRSNERLCAVEELAADPIQLD